MTTRQFSVENAPTGASARLDRFLADRFPEYSRSYFQQLLKQGAVALNGKKAEKDARVKKGDSISVAFREKEDITLAPDSTVPFRIIADEKEFVVVDKPAGVVVHPSATHKKGTLVNGLLARWPGLHTVGESPVRPGIVHRLDKETSGLMVIAKTPEMFLWLKKQFQDRRVEKKYTALVFGKLARLAGAISAPIARVGARQVAVGDRRTGAEKKIREAETVFRVLKSYSGATLVEVMPKTGRMHQIRVHFKHIGHPIVGDKTYAPPCLFKSVPCARQFLHAGFLTFPLPDGRTVSFFSPLPEDLGTVLAGLEKK
ncbi:MAG: RluA family pseudouridine synthase [Patescibacteria group bacterium]